jgi:HEAT repeat protein
MLACLPLLCLAIGLVAGLASAAEEPPEDEDTSILRQARIPRDDASVVAFLRKRSPSGADLQLAERLIRQLASADFAERDAAARRLADLGPAAWPALRQALKHDDPEVRRRAKACLAGADAFPHLNVPLGAVRWLLRRQPPEVVESLLGYLPWAADEEVEEEIGFGLDGLVAHTRRIPPALRKALGDTQPSRRALAACILGHRGDEGDRATVRKLLVDPAPLVRLRAAQGLLAAGNTEGLPALVELLKEPAVELSWQAEELLHWAAGGRGPTQSVKAGEAADRQRCHAAWQEWWRKEGAHLDPKALGKKTCRPGLLLVCEQVRNPFDGRRWSGRVWLLGCDASPRWELRDLVRPVDAQLLPGKRILVADNHPAPLFTERQLDGQTVRVIPTSPLTYRDFLPVTARRLANGNTFLAADGSVQEITPEGQVCYCYRDIGYPPLLGAQKLPDGRICCVLAYTEKRERFVLVEYDSATAKLVRQVLLPTVIPSKTYHCSLEILRNNHTLLLGRWGETLGCEIDGTGRVVWEHKDWSAHSATRLRDGTTLVAGRDGGRGYLAEVAGASNVVGKIDWRADGPRVAFSYARLRDCLGLIRLGWVTQRAHISKAPN